MQILVKIQGMFLELFLNWIHPCFLGSMQLVNDDFSNFLNIISKIND
jgi:hypothetical protein